MCAKPAKANCPRIGNILEDFEAQPAFQAFCLMTTNELQAEYQAMNRLANEGHDGPCVCGERGCSLCLGVKDVSVKAEA